MKIYQVFRYELDPNNAQRTLLAKHAGAARFAYNWGLARRIEMFEKNKGRDRFTSAIERHRGLNLLKKTELRWLYEVSKSAPQESLRNLDHAFRSFWRARKEGRYVGFAKFRKKGIDDKFRLTGIMGIEDLRHIRFPRIGKIRVKEGTSKFTGRILSATVKREADRWVVSLCVEREREEPEPVTGPVTGVDLGLTCFAVLSDGTRIESPKPLTKNLRLLRKRSRWHSRKQRGSKNRQKSRIRLARLHVRIRNIRKDWIHKLTTMLAETKWVIVVEDLSVRNFMRNRHLARAISDAGWSEFKRQLAYKTCWYGSELVIAPKYSPSTRCCSRCGVVGQRLDLSCRVFGCSFCDFTVDRDENAARNLQWYGQFGRNPYACGESSVGGTCSCTVYEAWLDEAGSNRRLSFGING